MWITGLEAVKNKIGVKVVYDLSATPFFLRGSGHPEGALFPWVVSDFSLIDAIECGIVKVPRVPISDDTMQTGMPTYRDIWFRIKDHLPKKGRGSKDENEVVDPKLPQELEGALISLYGNYEKYYKQWEQNTAAKTRGATPPVFIVVCNNTSVSKLVYDWVSGYEKPLTDNQTVIVPGNLNIFNNANDYGQWRSIANTILIDSEQLESGEAMSKEFKQMAQVAIEDFKNDYHKRFPDRSTDELTEEDLLREVMNTVGKSGKLGENVRCVISVSMLTKAGMPILSRISWGFVLSPLNCFVNRLLDVLYAAAAMKPKKTACLKRNTPRSMACHSPLFRVPDRVLIPNRLNRLLAFAL